MRQAIIHKAEEYGQSRPYTSEEVRAAERAAIGFGIYCAVLGLTIAGAILLYNEIGLSWTLAILAPFAGFLGGAGWILLKGLNEQLDGLRSYRSVETFSPPLPEPQQQTPSPVIVNPYGGTPYILDGEQRIALPDGRQSSLALNPPTLEAILKEVIQQHGGQWSRRRLMGIRVSGQRVTRSLYEQMTDALTKARFLQPQPNGGYALPGDVQEFDDLRKYLPGLGRREGGREGGKGGWEIAPPGGKGEGALTLAEQRRQKWIECDCDVARYLEGKL